LHIEQAQLFPTDHAGVGTSAIWAGEFYAGGVEIMPAILAVMTNGQNLYDKLRAFGDGAASGRGEGGLQAVGIENAAAANFNLEPKDAADGTLIGHLVHNFQDVIRDFVFVHGLTSHRGFHLVLSTAASWAFRRIVVYILQHIVAVTV
jgi:hypothetical protein